MRPDWSQAPEWAQYAAMDADGRWYWHEEYPKAHWQIGQWLNNGTNDKESAFDSCSEWYQEMEQRPGM